MMLSNKKRETLSICSIDGICVYFDVVYMYMLSSVKYEILLVMFFRIWDVSLSYLA